MATPAVVNVASAGSSPIATFQQTQSGITVQVQQGAIVDPTSGQGATVDANGLHVVLSTGALATSGSLTATSIVSQGSETISSSVKVTSGKTGTLQHAIFAGTTPMQWALQTVDNSSAATTVATFFTNAYESFDFKPGSLGEIATVASTGNALFQVVATNLSMAANPTGTAFASFFWAEN